MSWTMEKEMGTYSSIPAHGQRSLVGYTVHGGRKRVRHDLVTRQQTTAQFGKARRKGTGEERPRILPAPPGTRRSLFTPPASSHRQSLGILAVALSRPAELLS